MADIATIAEIGTAGGTLLLGVATFASVRSANRSARVAERSLRLNLRPVLAPARPDDPVQEIGFGDGRRIEVAGGRAAIAVDDGVVYLAIALRNVGAGLAVLSRYDISVRGPLLESSQLATAAAGDFSGIHDRSQRRHRPVEDFRQQRRDLFIAPGDIGFWQAALRDPSDPLREEVAAAIGGEPEPITVDVLYGDVEDGQHLISRFNLFPDDDGSWTASVAFHWALDVPDPRAE